ncbi:hypothetical protein [Orlajensenia leifsoniae]|uniref:Uncharacterized protein n=1 Tax=Orlajensenia leifsoniae TaxID=2561933 RepID=A0A4Y9QW46_9MICO|nr:hypothetical protein [Leifsonia flava]TFV96754.1 hypothetical protein E4M00_11805 [Leifsonia flava]
MLEVERTPLRLSLIENAYDSFAESLAYVERAREDPTRWKFAVLNLVHAVELVLKQRLVQEHDLLIWQDVDRPGKLTVGLEKAIQRLSTARVSMDDADVQAIQTAIKWRNNITHYEVDLIAEEVRENYLLIFEFLDKFHDAHFSGSLSDHIPDEHVQTAMDLAESFRREFIEFRGRQMHRSWPRKLVAAQNATFLELDGVRFLRTKWGSEAYWIEDHMQGYEPLPFCRDCGAALGEYHGPGCCVEECPREKSQLFGCECDWAPSELWALDADEWMEADGGSNELSEGPSGSNQPSPEPEDS